MTIDCPVCKAVNPAGPACRRCKADLVLLIAIDEERRELLRRVGAAYHRGEFDHARELAQRADGLCVGPDSSRWLAILNLLAGRHDEAWRAYKAVNSHG